MLILCCAVLINNVLIECSKMSIIVYSCGCRITVLPELPKLVTRVRLPSAAASYTFHKVMS